MKPEDAWQATVGEIEISAGKGNYLTWLRSARFVSYEDGQFIIGVTNGYVKDWMEHRMAATLQKALTDRMGRSVEVSVVLLTQNGAISSAISVNRDIESALDKTARERDAVSPEARAVLQPDTPIRLRPAAGSMQPMSDGLISRYTFESFVVGSGNRMAHAAAMSVAEFPPDRYNPLFLYGGSGLGKTHLLHAIGHAARKHGMTCVYVTSEAFVNELITAIRAQATEAFRQKYRHVDMLLMDDAQFIAGKESTQEEFFHTFNTLHSANKQIVLTSDRAPKSMVTLEDRLRSRFEWGLMADIAPPDYETRVAILQQKSAQRNLVMPSEVIEFVAKQVQSNVRELEGALNRLFATAELTGRSLSVQLARDTLADLVGRRSHITPSQVIETCAKFYNISVPEIVSASRSREMVQPRQVAMYLIRQETDASLPEIGGLLGGRDHTTVIHGVERIKERLETEDNLRRDVMSIREALAQNVLTA